MSSRQTTIQAKNLPSDQSIFLCDRSQILYQVPKSIQEQNAKQFLQYYSQCLQKNDTYNPWQSLNVEEPTYKTQRKTVKRTRKYYIPEKRQKQQFLLLKQANNLNIKNNTARIPFQISNQIIKNHEQNEQKIKTLQRLKNNKQNISKQLSIKANSLKKNKKQRNNIQIKKDIQMVYSWMRKRSESDSIDHLFQKLQITRQKNSKINQKLPSLFIRTFNQKFY